MNRTLALLALALAACGSSNLKSASSKELEVNCDQWPDGGGKVRLLLNSTNCPTFDESVVATLNDQPMKLVSPGGRATFDENKCGTPVWHFDGPLPAGDWHLVLHDDSDTVELVLTDATHTPPVSLDRNTVTRGQDFAVDAGSHGSALTGVRVVAADGTTAELPTSQPLVLPSTFPTGPAQLFAEFQLVVPAKATGDATAGLNVLNLDSPALAVTVQ